MHRSTVKLAALVAAGVLALTACGGASAAGSGSGSGEGRFDPAQPVRYALSVIGRQWDPHRSTSQNADTPMMVLVYDRLFALDGDGGVVPQLATAHTLSPDGLTLTLDLRDDVTFQDGRKFDSSVVVANLERAKGEQSTVAPQLAIVTDVVADGPDKVVLTLSAKDPTLLLRLATTTGAMISPAALTAPDLQQKPAGSGPFTLVSFGTDRVVLARNPNYWDKQLRVPDQVEIIGINDEAARVNLLTSGGADMVTIGPSTWKQAEDLGNSGEYALHVYGGALQQFLFLDAAVPPLDNPRVRMAINLAIDRDGIAAALDGSCEASSQVLPAGTPGHVDGLKYPFDVDRARRILAEEGVSDLKLDTLVGNFEPVRTVAEIEQGMLANVGITLNLVPTEPALVRSVFAEGKYGALIHQTSTSYPDPSVLMATQVGGQLDPGKGGIALAQQAEAARLLDLGSPERTAAYEDLTRKLFDQPTHVPVCNQVVALLTRPNVLGVDKLPFSQVSSAFDIRGVGLTG